MGLLHLCLRAHVVQLFYLRLASAVMRQGAPRICARGAGGGLGCIASTKRGYTRGIPYTPLGTIQDYTSSPRHGNLAEMQRNIDKGAGRAPTGLYEGPTITTKEGPRPLLSAESARHPSRGPTPRAASSPPYAPQFTAATTGEDMTPLLSDSYQRDLRCDPAYADDPQHIVAARQRVRTMQNDSYGEAMRGIVAPPPPLDPEAPQTYRQPRVQLDESWWMLMFSFAVLFMLMAMYGK